MASLVTTNVMRSLLLRLDVSQRMPLPVMFLCAMLINSAGGIHVAYFSSNCNAAVIADVGGLIEPELGLYYRENIDCTLTLVGLPTHRILLQFHRFALESGTNGKCLDSLSVFDGNTIDGPPLTPELCGRLHQLPDVTSSGNNITFRFKTDDSGRGFGFGIYYTQFTGAPCLSGQFMCNNSRCINQSLVCNTLNMCGDWSDEGNCTAPPPEPAGLSILAIAGIGMSIIFVAMAIIFACAKIVQVRRSDEMLKEMMAEVERDIKINPYSESEKPKNDDVGFSGRVLGRKRSAKVAPQQ